MLIRISLIVAIIAGLAIAALNFTKVKDKVTTLQTDLKQETADHAKFLGLYNKTKADLAATNIVLAATKATLEQTTTERDDYLKKADEQSKRADGLQKDFDKTVIERNEAREELAAFKATGLTPKQVTTLRDELNLLQKNLTGVQAENKLLGQTVAKLQTELDRYRDPNKPVYLPASLQGKVVVVDPKYNFVLLNIGEENNLREYGQMLVNRNGRLVAKVIVSSLQKNRSIANVMPGWEIGQVMEGDLVIPAYPSPQ